MAKYIGNLVIVLSRPTKSSELQTALVLKPPKNKMDKRRKRKRVAYGLWIHPGGRTERYDKSQKQAAQRELRQETGLIFSLKLFRKVAILRGYIGSTSKPTWLVHVYMIRTNVCRKALRPGKNLLKAKWFPVNRLPFRHMLTGDKDWIPKIIAGKKLMVRVYSTGETNAIKTWSIKYVHSFN